jgi:hypothetical protein
MDAVQEKKSTTTVTDSTIELTGTEHVNMDSVVNTAPVVSVADPSLLLKFNVPKGKTFDYTTEIDIIQQEEGQKISSKMMYNYILKVASENKTSKTLNVTYGKMLMDMNMMGQSMRFSSEDKPDATGNPLQMIGRMFSAMKGKSFTMKVAPDGNILSVDGFDKLPQQVMLEMKIPESQQAFFLKSFESQFNDDMVKEMFTQGFNFLPNKTVKPGDSWTKTSKIPLQTSSIDISTVYTVKEIKNNQVIIDAIAKYLHDNQNPTTSRTRMVVDATSGMIVSAVGESKKDGSNVVVSRNKITSRQL